MNTCKFVLFLIILNCSFSLMFSQQFLTDKNCWVDAYSRGLGTTPNVCPKNEPDQSGLLCYAHCKVGYEGLGPVCWQKCPDDFRDDGAFCAKPSPYTRGTYTSKEVCQQDEGKVCEKWGLFWYPQCNPGFHNVACCVCSPDCPEGMSDIGVSCAKNSYGRGTGSFATCAEGKLKSAGRCFDEECRSGFTGVGPICWGSCPSTYRSCGPLCLQNGDCLTELLTYVDAVKQLVSDLVAKEYQKAALNLAKLVTDNMYPNCSEMY